MTDISEKKDPTGSVLLRKYRSRCLLIGTFGFGGFMSVVLFAGLLIPPSVRLPWLAELALAVFVFMPCGTLWGIMFYLTSRRRMMKQIESGHAGTQT